MSNLPKVNLVVIGHKDHGKSTLIGRLLYDSKAIPEPKLKVIMEELKQSGKKEFEFAFLLDSLEEEREGGLTIDIMHTPFKSKKYFYTIIDCPGHKEFIKKMLTGASKADAAVLVVSAKEGIEDQTRQHLFLAKTLGINQLVIAVNKMDMVNYSNKVFQRISKKIRGIADSLGYEETPIIPVSAYEGENVIRKSDKMNWYDGATLIETLDSSIKPFKPPVEKPLRCPVQDQYQIGGERVILCKIETGTLKVGDEVIRAPEGDKGYVKKILSPSGESTNATPGDSVGLIIDGLGDVSRGDVLSHLTDPAREVKSFTAEIILFSEIGLQTGDIVTVRAGTAERRCKITEIIEKIDPVSLLVTETNPTKLVEGDVGRVIFKPIEPLCLEIYSEIPEMGRFVIVGKKGAEAAGIVLEREV